MFEHSLSGFSIVKAEFQHEAWVTNFIMELGTFLTQISDNEQLEFSATVRRRDIEENEAGNSVVLPERYKRQREVDAPSKT